MTDNQQGFSAGRAVVALSLAGLLVIPAVGTVSAAPAQAESEPTDLATLMDMAPQADLGLGAELDDEWGSQDRQSATDLTTDPVPDPAATAPAAPAGKIKRGRLEISTRGETVKKKVRVVLLGLTGDAVGFRRGVNVGSSRVVKRLPQGKYSLTGEAAFSGKRVALPRTEPTVHVKPRKTKSVSIKYAEQSRAILDQKFRTMKAGLKPVSPEAHPYARTVPVALVDPLPHDAKGVRTVFRRGAFHYHPVGQAHYGIANVESFRLTGNRAYLLRAVAQGTHLINTADKGLGGPLFPYTFAFKAMNPTWYSAMAQGQSLSLFTALAEATGKKKWRKAADKTFGTFLERGFRRSDDSVVEVRKKNLWLVEYPKWPQENSKLVLNGHMFAMFGIYDYFQMTKDKRAKQIFQGATRTVVDRLDTLRVPAGVSFYSLDKIVQSEYYHHVHVAQLAVMARITGKQQFLGYSNNLRSDFFSPDSVADLSPSQ